MKTLDVIILKGGKTAKEINPLGEKPYRRIRMRYMTKNLKKSLKLDTDLWRNSEKNRRTFEIDFSSLIKFFKLLEKKTGAKIHHAHFGLDVGTHRKAQVLHSGKIKIL